MYYTHQFFFSLIIFSLINYVYVHAKSLQSCLTLCEPIDCSPPGPSWHLCPWGLQPPWSGLPCPPPGYLPNPGTEPMSLTCPTLARTIQSMEFSGHNTGVGSLSLLQGIFPTQGSNTGLPDCRQILYQLSHK